VHRLIRSIAGLAVAVLVASLAAAAPASAATTKTCKNEIKGKERKLGATYVTVVKVTGVTCSSAFSVVKAFHSCRRANGGADGRCTKKVRGYSCAEAKRLAGPLSFDAKVTCKSASKKIAFSYTQNT